MSAAASHIGYRRLGRGSIGGILLTLGVHGALGFLIYQSQIKSEPRPEAPRDLMVTHMVTLGKPREKFWLPRIQQAPPPPKPKAEPIKIAENPLTPPTPPAPPPPKEPPKEKDKEPPPKEAPRPEDKQQASDLKRALQRAKMLSQAAKEEPAEGSLTGSSEGTTSTAEEGDAYATAVHNAIKQNWVTPTGLLNDSQLASLSTDVRISIDADGRIVNPTLAHASGNGLFDDSCIQAVRTTRQVPPPPAAVRAKFRRGVLLTFEGKELAH